MPAMFSVKIIRLLILFNRTSGKFMSFNLVRGLISYQFGYGPIQCNILMVQEILFCFSPGKFQLSGFNDVVHPGYPS